MRFRDRREAGRLLAQRLGAYKGREDLLVLALPRGGVPVGFEVARELQAPLDVLLVRKLGLPGHEELAIGAVATGGIRVVDESLLAQFGISRATLEQIAEREQLELQRREQAYRGALPPHEVRGKTVLLVDDGLATGSSMRAAVLALRQSAPARLVVAVPVAPPSTCAALREEADDVVCARTPEPFSAVGQWYEDFRQTTDEEVRELLAAAAEPARVARLSTA
jgi:putative phosphoribosyl transferase